jgi:hypothetical protein
MNIYILRKSIDNSQTSIKEALIIVPKNNSNNKCMLFFYSNIDLRQSDKDYLYPLIAEKVVLNRM